jgi:hypothetical protein
MGVINMKSRLKKLAMDFGDRDFAIAYINGEVFRSRTHANCINKYLMSKSISCLNAVRYRPDIKDIDKLDDENVDKILTQYDQEDLAIIRDNITQLAFAHAVDGSNEDSGHCEEDGKHIYIERDTLFNVDFNTVVNTIKQAYSEYTIYDEETETKVARLKGSLKKTAGTSMVIFDYMTLKSGDGIEFSGRICSNRPWFQITHESQFNNSSYYDGPDFDRAVDLYKELLLAFKGVKGAEKAKQIQGMFDMKVAQLKSEENKFRTQDLYRILKEQPAFLGISF